LPHSPAIAPTSSAASRSRTDTQNGFFADPIYGGNKDMAAWKMIGFPGTHYDYREWIERHNERVTLPTVSIASHPNWSQ
jgi:gluconate 2-dehydrogenase gamma chain